MDFSSFYFDDFSEIDGFDNLEIQEITSANASKNKQ